jgi:hypothetical protein
VCNSDLSQDWQTLKENDLLPSQLDRDQTNFCKYFRINTANEFTNICSNSLLFLISIGLLITIKKKNYKVDATYKVLIFMIIGHSLAFLVANILLYELGRVQVLAYAIDN